MSNFFEMFTTGTSEKELLNKEILLNGKPLEVPKLKTKHIKKALGILKGLDWENLNYAQVVDTILILTPVFTGLEEKDFDEIELEDLEPFFVQFKKKNVYFLQILHKSGISEKIKEIVDSFGITASSILEK